MAVTGPDFIALQVRDVERAATFYETQLGLHRAPAAPPGAVVFETSPIPFAVREPLPGVDLDQAPRPGVGVALWLFCDQVQELHDSLAGEGTLDCLPFLGHAQTLGFRPPDVIPCTPPQSH